MKKDYVSYVPVRYPFNGPEVISKLPDWIRSALIESVAEQGGIWVERNKVDVIAYLDHFFQIGEILNFTRYDHVEISQEHIDEYDFFKISPISLDLGRDVDFKFVEPTCPLKRCQTGARITSDITLLKQKMEQYELASIYWVWEKEIELIISHRLKEVFEGNGITGLRYEPCSPKSTTEGFFRATITTTIPHIADDIVVLSVCEACDTILNYALMGEHIDSKTVQALDFQMIDSVIVKGKTYYYRKNAWMISRRVLRILSERKTKGLGGCGFLLKEKFLPVVITKQ
jgi:hypothetical protein